MKPKRDASPGGNRGDGHRLSTAAPFPTSELTSLAADFFKTLADPTRLSVIRAILSRELCVREISELLRMSQSAVSHQLRLLRGAGLARRRRQGRKIYYSLDDKHVESLVKAAFEHASHNAAGKRRE